MVFERQKNIFFSNCLIYNSEENIENWKEIRTKIRLSIWRMDNIRVALTKWAKVQYVCQKIVYTFKGISLKLKSQGFVPFFPMNFVVYLMNSHNLLSTLYSVSKLRHFILSLYSCWVYCFTSSMQFSSQINWLFSEWGTTQCYVIRLSDGYRLAEVMKLFLLYMKRSNEECAK